MAIHLNSKKKLVKNRPKNYIFDFDGTIADSLPAFIAVFNKLVRNNQNPLTPEEIQSLRNVGLRKAIKMAGLKWWQVPKLLVMGISDFHALVPGLEPFEDIPKVIKQLHARGDKLFIVTSNTQESVSTFLSKHNLEGYFEDTYANAGLFNKSRYINRIIVRNKLKRRDCIYIGDEVRDVKAARLSLIKVASVTWGFNTQNILSKQKPTYIINKPMQILDLPVRGKK